MAKEERVLTAKSIKNSTRQPKRRERLKRRETSLILHNIRSAYNVGSIFRTADALGVSKIFLTGYTSSPTDALGKYRKDISKTALGAERFVPWEKIKSIDKAVKILKAMKIQIVALEQAKSAPDIGKFKPHYPFALLLGNEVRGISKALLKKCDAVTEIPMQGKKESLNVSVAAGIALYALCGSLSGRQ